MTPIPGGCEDRFIFIGHTTPCEEKPGLADLRSYSPRSANPGLFNVVLIPGAVATLRPGPPTPAPYIPSVALAI